MTDSSNDPQLQDLEPLDSGDAPVAAPAAGSAIDEATLQVLRAGLAPPAFNPRCTDKASYRFLMCGVLMLLGGLMPFGADLQQAGYKTMSGAFFAFVGLGMVWTWWGAIHNNRSTGASLKWLGLCVVPLIAQLMNLIAYDPVLALEQAKAAGHLPAAAQISDSWNAMFSDMLLGLSKKADAADGATRVEHFFRCFGTGRFFVFVGALLAEIFFVAGIVGGAKQNKQQKLARMAQASERKRR
jgi:hypothetical protein